MTEDPSVPLRILIHDYCGHPFQIQLSRWLAKQGHRVHHVYSADIESPHGAMERRPDDPDEFQIVALSTGRPLRKYDIFRRLWQEIRYSRLVAQTIRRASPHIVISGNAPPHIQAVMVFASHRSGIPFVYWVQDIWNLGIAEALEKRFGSWSRALFKWIAAFEYRAIRSADHVIPISSDFLPILEEYGVDRNKTTAIENWAVLEDVPVLNKVNEWSQERGWDKKFVFLYTGTLGFKHNPEILVKLAKIFEGDPNVVVAVASQGIGRQYLEAERERLGLKNLELEDFLPFEELPLAMASSDVLLAILEANASVFAVPSKVLTYLCAARPILASIRPENLAARVISESGAGVNTHPDEPESFLRVATALRSAPLAQRQDYGRSARAYADRNFSIAQIGTRFLQVCESR